MSFHLVFCSKSCSCPAGNYMFKVNNRNTRARCEICSKLIAGGVRIITGQLCGQYLLNVINKDSGIVDDTNQLRNSTVIKTTLI